MRLARLPVRDKLILGFFVLESLVVGGYFLAKRVQPDDLAETSLARTDIIGDDPRIRGDARAAYTLVEFGDFQCPPCAVAEEKVDGLLMAFPNMINVVFRNNPLQIHSLAIPCALLAEAASTNEEYWLRHRALFALQPRLSENSIAELGRTFDNRDKPNAITRLGHDMELAKKLKLNSTPAFFLVEPNGKVYRASSLDSVERAIH